MGSHYRSKPGQCASERSTVARREAIEGRRGPGLDAGRGRAGGGRAVAASTVGLVFAAAAASGCHGDPPVLTRTVTLHSPGPCAPGATALDGGAYVTYSGLGDFDAPSAQPAGHLIGQVGAILPEIGEACRMLVVEATESDATWSGVGVVAAQGNVDVLLWPSLRSCALPAPLGARTGSTLAPIANQTVLLVGGVAPGVAGPPSPTYVAHLDTGAVAVVQTDLLTPRVGASVTAFGAGALVAGGSDPSSGGSVLDSAEIYGAPTGGFDQRNRIFLSAPRAYHGAVQLATGETLLVGGVGGQDGQTVLDSMEIVDPSTLTVRAENIARLSVARRVPDVLRLASGEVMVAGGVDANGNSVSTIEWFSPDVTAATKRPTELVSGVAHAYAALESGGALAVVTPALDAGANFQNVWVIGADGALEAALPIAGAVTQPVLFGGAGGSPVLWTGDRWLRWQPWNGSFGALGALDETPAAVPSGTAVASPDPGLAMWLDPNLSLITALRFDVRGEYSPLAPALLVQNADDTAPDGLVGTAGSTFDPSLGLILGPGASAFVTDRTYADVAIDVDAPTGEPALVVLRDPLGNELEVGGAGCLGQLSAPLPPVASSLHVERRGSAVTWTLAAGASGTCATTVTPTARLAIGLRGPPQTGRSVVTNLRVVRR
jgi:hypothetical protein